MHQTLNSFNILQILKRLISPVRTIESITGDWLMNVNTRGSVFFNKQRGEYGDAFNFETNAHITIINTIRLIHLKENDIVYILGCGKGRTVCHFGRQKVHKVIGIEIDRDLSEVARNNVMKLRGKQAEVEIINNDAASIEGS